LSVLPQGGGTFNLPPLRIPYFDTERGVMDVAESPGPRLVVPAASAATMATDAAKTPEQIPNPAGNPSLTWQITTAVFALSWIITLILLWKRRRPKILAVQNNTPPTRPTIPMTNPHPLQTQLLAAFGSRTLEQGLNVWEARRGGDAAMRNTVRAVQQLCYGQGCGADGDALRRAVAMAVTRIRATSPDTAPATGDPWRPDAFSATSSTQ